MHMISTPPCPAAVLLRPGTDAILGVVARQAAPRIAGPPNPWEALEKIDINALLKI